jgi:hypothetical protein
VYQEIGPDFFSSALFVIAWLISTHRKCGIRAGPFCRVNVSWAQLQQVERIAKLTTTR